MKTQFTVYSKKGFTLMELMVAMAITTIIASVLVSITSIALETWNRSRSELRASRQAKSLVDSMARDFEALVTRRGNTNEWLSAVTPNSMPGGNLKSNSASKLIFLTAATDRYDGMIGTTADRGGDVSCVAYDLTYKDPIGGGTTGFKTFVLNRFLVNPDLTFANLLGQTSLVTAFSNYNNELAKPERFVCENIYQYSVTFHIQVSRNSGTGATAATTTTSVPIVVGAFNPGGSGQNSKEFSITGAGNIVSSAITGYTADELKAGRLTAVEIALTVISDFGIDQLRTRTFSSAQQADFLAKNSYQYSKLVQLPSM